MARRNSGYEMQQAFDKYANALTVITEPHRMIHDGYAYHASGKITGILAAGIHEMMFRVPAGAYPHLHVLRMQFGAGDVDMVAYEGVTVSADGTEVPSHNLNRNSSNVPAMLLFDSPTVTDDGLEIHRQWTPPTATGQGQSVEGVVNVEQGEEWVLKPSTDYLFRITNNSSDTIDMGFEVMWYEIGEDH